MKQSTSFAQVATNLLNVLQGYTKGIRFVAVLTMLLIVGIGQAWGADATATATLSFANKAQRTSFSTTQQVWEQNGVTFTNDKSSSTNNVADYAAPVRLYANSSVTVACSLGNMTKIVFNANTTGYANALGTSIGNTATVSSKAVTVNLDGTSNTFTVDKLTAQVRLDAITVTYEKGSSTVSVTSITLNKTKLDLIVNATEQLTATVLPNDATNKNVSWSSNNIAVATVNDNGLVTAVGEGEATITVTTEDGNKTATCIISVTAPAGGDDDGDCEYVWELVTDASSLAAGDEIVIAAKDYNYALSTTQNNNNRGQASITKEGNTITWSSGVQIITLGSGVSYNGTFVFNTGLGYLYAAGANSNNYLRTNPNTIANGDWEIAITNNIAYITAQGTASRNMLRYNTSGLFSCYAEDNTQKDIVIYKKTCITEPTQLATPIELNVTNITSTSATLSWGEVANASSYTVFITDLDDEEITLTDIEEASVDVTGLSPETLYLWDVVAIGDGTNYTDSEHSSQTDPNAEFTTLKACEKLGAATGLTVETDFEHTDGNIYVKFSWTPANNTKNYATNQKLCFGKVGEAGTCVDDLAKNLTWTGDLKSKLEPGEYWWSIQALGDGTNYCDGDVVNGTNFTIEAPTYTVTFNAGSGTCDDESLTETSGGAGVTLPTANPPAACATDGWEFAGWWTESVAETTTSPGELLTAGSNYKPTSNCILYAVYSHTEAGGGGSGFYLSVTKDATTYYIGEKGSGSFLSAVTDVNSAATFNIENNRYLYYGNKTYVSSTENSTSLTIATTTPTVTWAITDEGETITFKSNGTGGRYLAFNYNNGSPRFSSYGNTYTYELTKHTTSTTTYNSNPVCLEPVWEGATIDKTNLIVNCGERSPMTGDNGAAIISFPTEDIYNFTKDITIEATTGFLVSTSKSVDANYQSSVSLSPLVGTINANTFYDKFVYVRAEAPAMSEEDLSGTITIKNSKGETLQTFSVTADVTCTQYTLTLVDRGVLTEQPTKYYAGETIDEAPADPEGVCTDPIHYVFDGWAEATVAAGTTTYTKVTFPYTVTGNTKFYAVYRYVEDGSADSGDYVKLTEDLDDYSGDYLIVYEAGNLALNGALVGDGLDASGNSISVTITDNTIVATDEVNASNFTIAKEDDGYSIRSASGYYIGQTTNGNDLKTNSTEYYANTITLSNDDNVNIVSGGAYLRYNANSGNTNLRFRYYNSENYTDQKAIALYKKAASYLYTTSPACDPMITIGSEVPVMVTSAKDIRVDAVQNITISATNLDQNADKAQVSIKIVSDNSAFKFKEVDANGDGQATLTWTGIANATFDKTLCVTYTPTEAGQEETATLTVTAYRHNGSTEYATATMQVRGRSLPEQFVLVANTGDGWVALPNTLGTGSSASIPYPIAVEVDNDANPTSIPQAPSTTIYKAAARSSVNAVPTGLRFTTEAGGYLQASASETNIWLSSNNSENMQSWTLNSTDFVDYSIRVNNSAEGAYLNYNTTQKKIGNYKSDNKLRILPVGAICEQHAAPEDLELTSVYATSATIQWSAVSTATSGYEYRVGATGEWTKVGNITELELTGLTSLTNYIIYVRASVEGSAINCSYESEVEFTTLNCDDVPSDIHYASGANSVTVYWACEAATSTVSLYRDKEGLSLVETKTSVTSPCQFTGLDKFTTYYVQILAGGFCPSGMIQVSTEQLDLDVVEWMSDGVVVDVNTDETITVTLENEVQYGSGVGQVAEELFFSKYFEGSGNLKLLAIYNGTGKDVDLSTYSIKLARNGNATNVEKNYDLSLLGTIKRGQEIIFYTKPSSGEYPYNCSQSFLASKTNESGIDANPRWILCDNAAHNGITYETLDFSGDDPLLFYKGSALIDVFGVSTAADRPSKKTQCSGRSEESWSADEVTNMDYNKTAADFEGGVVPEGVDLLNPTITAYTARVIMFRKNTVTSGSAAVSGNETDFVTFASEWEARSVCKSGDDGNLTCGAYQELGKFDYADYYTKYETIAGEQGFDENARLEDGTIKIRIPNLSTYSCKNIKFNVKVGGVTINEVTKVPILIANEQSTNGGEVFTNLKTTLGTTIVNGSDVTIEPLTDEQLLEKCEVCDIVVLASGQLTHEAEGIDQFNDLTIYPEGVFHNTSEFNVNRLLIHAKKDDVGYAIIENEGVSLTTDAIAHTKRIDAQYWYAFSLPYDCNINEITQANGESMGEYGVHWGIQYYDGKRRQQEGTSANLGQSSKFWLPMGPNDKLNAYQGYLIALFDASVQKPTDMRTIYFPPAEENTYTESGSDSKQTNVYSWNVNLTCEKRHHGWNFTGTPYISMFNPVAAGITDADLSNVLMTGTWDPVENEYEENEHVYVSIPTPNGGKYYNQHLASTKELLPFMAYFVQTSDPTTDDETKQLTYAKGGRELPAAAPARAAATAQRVLVELLVTAPDGQTDNTGVWVDENYVPEYELAADLTKMYVAGEKPQLYTLAANNEKMAYNALPDGAATNIPLGLYAPIAGDYNLSLNERMSRIAGAESVELIYNNAVVANLLFQDYTITAKKGNVNGYSLCIRRRANVTTAVDNVTGSVITMIVNDGYISVLGVATDATVYVYDMVGHLMEMQSANGNTVVNMPSVPQGVYNIVITNDKGSTTIKSFVK